MNDLAFYLWLLGALFALAVTAVALLRAQGLLGPAWLNRLAKRHALATKLKAMVDSLRAQLQALHVQARPEDRLPIVLVLADRGSDVDVLMKQLARDARAQDVGVKTQQQAGMLPTDGALLVNANAAGRGDARFAAALRRLLRLRASRPADAVLIAVSARTMLAGGQAVEHTARMLHKQLWHVQKRLQLCVPVYVVISDADALVGFAEFVGVAGQAIAGVREQMFGWSSPFPVDEQPSETWATTAVRALYDRMLLLQGRMHGTGFSAGPVAARQLAQLPQALEELRAPLSVFVKNAFGPATYMVGVRLRGFYLCGSAADPQVPFLQGVMKDKVLQERYLCSPTARRWLSPVPWRRWLQLAGAALLMLLFASLSATAASLDDYRVSARASAATMDLPDCRHRSHSCLPEGELPALLSELARLGQQPRYWNIPFSWLPHRVPEQTALQVRTALEQTVLPSLRLGLEARGAAVLRALQSLETQVAAPGLRVQQLTAAIQKVVDLERELARFAVLAGTSAGPEARLAAATALTWSPLDGAPNTGVELGSSPSLLAGFRLLGATPGVRLPEGFRADVVAAAVKTADKARAALVGLFEARPEVCARTLASAPQLRSAAAWLNELQRGWLGASETANPCRQLGMTLSAASEQLVGTGVYSTTDLAPVAAAYLSDAQCFTPIKASLIGTELGACGRLVTGTPPNELAARPACQAELSALERLVTQPFMQRSAGAAYKCDPKAPEAWSLAPLRRAEGVLSEYQAFIESASSAAAPDPAAPGGAAPAAEPAPATGRTDCAKRIAAAHAAQLVASELQQSQVRETSESGAVPFGVAAQTLLPLFWRYQQLEGLDLASTAFAGCIDGYARAEVTKTASQLDANAFVLKPGPDATGPFFPDASNKLAAQRYFDGQLQATRAQVLGAKAAIGWLEKRELPSEPVTALVTDSATQLDNFDNAVASNQVLSLQQTLVDVLAGLTATNCEAQLGASTGAAAGRDVFSMRRLEWIDLATRLCTDHENDALKNEYESFAVLYNTRLCGRYPFPMAASANVHCHNPQRREADPRDIRDAHARLQHLMPMSARLPARQQAFLKEVAAPLATLQQLVAPQPPLQLKLDFRLNAYTSPGTRQLVQWRLRIADKEVTYPNGGDTLPWSFGDPIEVELRWAALSPVRPLPDPQQRGLDVEQRSARFSERSAYALLKLVDAHGTADRAPVARGLVLRFELPVAQDPNAAASAARRNRPSRAASGASTPAAAPDPKRMVAYLGVTLASPDGQPFELPPSLPAVAPLIGLGVY